jgi:hypothetical protein
VVQLGNFCVAPDEAREATRRGCLESGPRRTGARELVDLHRPGHPLHGHRAEGPDLDEALGQSQGVRGEHDRAGQRRLLHPGRQMGRLTHRGVVHAEIAANGADHDLTRVQANADRERDPGRAAHLPGMPLHRLLHPEGSVAGPNGVILVGQRRPEEGHDAVTHHLVHGALVMVDRLHHVMEDRVE